MTNSQTDPIQALEENIREVKRLLQLHKEKAGDSPGRKHGLEVLNKSGIVLLVACWEAFFVEDLGAGAFDHMLANATAHTTFPDDVLTRASQDLKRAQDNREVWKLAGDGWKAVLQAHRKDVLQEYIGKLNTPKPKQVDELMEVLIGLSGLSSRWFWKGMSAGNASKRLTELVELRGSIAHRVSAARHVHKSDVRYYMRLVYRLAVKSSNAVREHVKARIGKYPWPSYRFGKVS